MLQAAYTDGMQLVLTMGLPASGKSSFVTSHLAELEWISKDRMPNNRSKSRRQKQLAEQALALGKSMVIDNTHPQAAERREWVDWAQARGLEVIGYYFASRLEDCLARNRQRHPTVPEVALFSIAKEFERPSREEGYNHLYYVSLDGGNFRVEAWDDEV